MTGLVPTILAVCVSLTVLILGVVAVLAFAAHRWRRGREERAIDVVEVPTARRDHRNLSQNNPYNIRPRYEDSMSYEWTSRDLFNNRDRYHQCASVAAAIRVMGEDLADGK